MNEPMHPSEPKYKTKKDASESSVFSPVKTNETTMAASTIDDDELERPTEAEEQCLRRVSGKVPWMAYSIAFVEMCERFSFFGTTAVCKFLLFLCWMRVSPDQVSLVVNFIQQPLPEGSTAGAAGTTTQPGALGQGQQASTGLTTFNTFWCYVTPILGAWIADEFLGRLKTIQLSIGFALLGHVILIISALPPVIAHPSGALGCFSVGLVIFGCGAGGFKSNISPLIAEQYKETRTYIKTLKTGERVIVDPAETISRIFLYFYCMINIGALIGSISMVYAERYIGFWFSFTLPTIMFCLCPAVLFLCRKKYSLTPPTGSVLGKAFKLWMLAFKMKWSWNPVTCIRNCRSPGFWEDTKPSKMAPAQIPVWMTFDDLWVDEVRRVMKACVVFLWYPIYWLAYGQMISNMTSQAATMELHGAPNDVILNLNPLATIICIPIMDKIVYPGLRRNGFRFTPLKRICVGFLLASSSMVAATVIQHYIYKTSPCGDHPSGCDRPAPINVWVQAVPYVLIAVSEILASITGYEYAYTKAPKNMKSLVQSLFLFMNAISSAIQQGLTALSKDPLLIWNYAFVAILAFVGGNLFYFAHRKLDGQEDELNAIQSSSFIGENGDHRAKDDDDEEKQRIIWERGVGGRGAGYCHEDEIELVEHRVQDRRMRR